MHMGARWTRVRSGLTGPEWRRAGLLALAILGLHVIGFGLLFLVVLPARLTLGTTGAFGIGVGITAYTLGMRHAFDADHIAAIDNTTRKLMTDGQRPLAVGFFFSLGHSTIVFLLAAAFALGIRGLSGAVADDSSTLHTVTGLIGPSVSGVFLVAIGVINLVVLVGIVQVFRRMRHGEYDEAQLEQQLRSRGFMNRILGRATDGIRASWQMYPLGVLFAAGMCLLDTIDGAFMNFAYGWAFSKPVRKVFYNITVTALSVAVALLVGVIELAAVLQAKLGLTGGVWDRVAALDLNDVGYVIVALFLVTWITALAVWRFARIEERWSRRLQRT